MKKVFFALAVVAMFSFVACNGNAAAEDTTATEPAIEEVAPEAVEEATSNPGYRYVLGSVLNQVLLQQSVIGLEAKTALDK